MRSSVSPKGTSREAPREDGQWVLDEASPPLTCVCVCVRTLRRLRLFVPLWTVARQAPPSMGFPRQEYWRGLPFPSLRDLPNPGIKSPSLASPALAGGLFTT